MTGKRTPIPPRHLRADGRRLWKRVTTAYELEDFQLEVLAAACGALDRHVAAREILDSEGLVVHHDKLGPRPHPAISIERDSRTAMLRALRELALDSEVIETAARPSLIGAGRRYGR